MVVVVIAMTGGFIIDAGPLYLSAHRLLPPLVIAVAAYLLAARQGHAAIVAADANLFEFVHRHALAIAIALAAVAAGVGIAFNTYVVAASDPSAYISQAHLITKGDLVVRVPLASQVSWPMPEMSFAPLGYRPGPQPAEIVPTYPPGLPLFMAIALLVAGENGPFFVGPFFAAVAVLGAYCLAARLHSRTAGVTAAAMMTFSPLLLSQVVQSMSDIPATAVWTLAVLAALAARPITAGVLSGLAIPVRPSLLPVAAVVALVLVRWSKQGITSRRAAFNTLIKFAAAAVPAIAVLAWTQWSLYGDPFASGHGTFAQMFSIRNVLPNIREYTIRVLTGETPVLVLLAASAVAFFVAPRRVSAGLKSTTHPTAVTPTAIASVRIAALVAMPVLACYLAYGVFTDWSYLRFLLPIWPAAFAAAGAIIVNARVHLSPAIRTQVLLVALTAVCARNVLTAAHEGSFTLWADALRYGTAGRYLDAVLPKNAVIIASEHSGSASYYTGRPILRWDSAISLDEAIDELTRLGRKPVIVLESWEEPLLRRRFPSSPLARLDWPARADFGRVTRVRFFDPADREHPTGRKPDRLP
jgi:hypothetical protein